MSDWDEVRVVTLEKRLRALEALTRRLDEELDTGWRTPCWKRALFWVDGWPLHRLADTPAWRPWRRWWRS